MIPFANTRNYGVGDETEIVRIVLAKHPKDCVFIKNTPEIVSAAVKARDPKIDWLEAMAEEIRKCELYCPHEGIDRMPTA